MGNVVLIVFVLSLALNFKVAIDENVFSQGKDFILGVIYSGQRDVAKDSVVENVNPAIVYYLNGDEVLKIHPVLLCNDNELPEKLIISPGTYSFSGKSYSLVREGLYRFVLPGDINVQRIVYGNDLIAFLSSISWIVTHGNADDKKSLKLLSNKALHSKLYVTCGTVSKWTQKLLYSIGITSRIVGGITIDEWNTYNNGHLLIEVWQIKWNKWVVFDLDNNCFFLPIDSEIPLSVVEWSSLVAKRRYRIQSISNDIRLDISGFRSRIGYDFGFVAEAINADLRSWYSRVMQVPFVYDENERIFRFTDADQKERIEAYSANYKYMDNKKFMEKYYTEVQSE